MSEIQDAFDWQLAVAGIDHESEFIAIPGRRYRWDFHITGTNILVEIQGGTWSRKRTGHSTGAGIRRDCEKANLAVLAGWRVLAFTSDMVRDGSALQVVKKARGE